MAQPEDRLEPGAADGPAEPNKTAKVPARKVPAKVPARVPAKKVPAKQATAKKAAPKKTAPKKTAPKTAPQKAGTKKVGADKAPSQERRVQPALAAPPPQAALTAGHSPAPAATGAAVQRADTPPAPGPTALGDYRLPVSLGLAAVGLVALVLSRLRRG